MQLKFHATVLHPLTVDILGLVLPRHCHQCTSSSKSRLRYHSRPLIHLIVLAGNASFPPSTLFNSHSLASWRYSLVCVKYCEGRIIITIRISVTMVSVRHDIHSHAHEEGVPGTINLQAREGEETHYGQALYPVPSLDPNDPLQV